MSFLVTVAKERNFRHFTKLVQEKSGREKVTPPKASWSSVNRLNLDAETAKEIFGRTMCRNVKIPVGS